MRVSCARRPSRTRDDAQRRLLRPAAHVAQRVQAVHAGEASAHGHAQRQVAVAKAERLVHDDQVAAGRRRTTGSRRRGQQAAHVSRRA